MSEFLKLITLVLVFSATARAGEQRGEKIKDSLDQRCPIDRIYDSDMGHGRNAWSLKCGYLPYEFSLTMLDAEEVYLTFADTIAPVDVDAPCIDNLKLLGMCYLGYFYDD